VTVGGGGRLYADARREDEPTLSWPTPEDPDEDVYVEAEAEEIEQHAETRRFPVDWREMWSNAVEFTGIGVLSAGFWLLSPWCGLVVLGLCLILIGMATGGRRSPPT